MHQITVILFDQNTDDLHEPTPPGERPHKASRMRLPDNGVESPFGIFVAGADAAMAGEGRIPCARALSEGEFSGPSITTADAKVAADRNVRAPVKVRRNER